MRAYANLGIVVLILAVLGCACPAKLSELAKKKNDTPPPAGSNTAPEAEPSTSPDDVDSDTHKKGDYDLSIEKYDQIHIGTPRSDVERILGGRGTEISTSKGGGMTFSVYKWEGEDYDSIILTFKDEKVMTKTQVGLK